MYVFILISVDSDGHLNNLQSLRRRGQLYKFLLLIMVMYDAVINLMVSILRQRWHLMS